MADFLKDKLRPASFRGVPFQVLGSNLDGVGRRLQAHEYPQRDKPYVQDLGRSTREIKFEAFVIGVDYVDKANALLGALEEYGPGTLVHPWFGSVKANALPSGVAFDQGLGLARFTLNFIESGELEFPSSADSTALLSRTAAAGLQTTSTDWFASVFKVAGFVSDVADKATTVYGQVLGFLANPAFALASLTGYSNLPGSLASLQALFGSPLALGGLFAGLLDLSGKAASSGITGSDAVALPVVRGLTRMAVSPALANPATVSQSAKASRQIAKNHPAILGHARQTVLVQAVHLSSFLACTVYDDTLALKNELAAALDAETLLATDDGVYQALMAARAAMWADLTSRSRNSARLVTITPPDVLPALVIAYGWHEDAGRDLEIVARNKVKNPGFVPVQPLRVLSS
jgi:prophage DNA circulation protein